LTPRLSLLQLGKLLILEGKYNEAKGSYKEAKEDYLACSRFIVHLSEQHSNLLIQSISGSYLDWLAGALTKQLLDDASYRKSLLENLRIVIISCRFASGSTRSAIVTTSDKKYYANQLFRTCQFFGINDILSQDRRFEQGF
jgi:hypothetical protein